VHEVAQVGFGREAEVYERSRPSYPPDAVAWLLDHLGVRAGTTVVDLAAGTGKLTRLLTPTGAAVVAVEPVEGMHRVGGDDDLAGLRVELDADVDLVAGADAGAAPVRGAERDHELAAHHGDRAPIGVAAHGDSDRQPLDCPQVGDDLGWHSEAGGGLAAEQDDGTEPGA
jgi:SAM-dependent methyltransferase